ncbi:archaeal proteasome endopeptidase complex subunit beta [Thermoproteus tenax]|uniref:Proteasome subunit beta n=1 Tax=Thermoproteus tenax (strain ATCC 35583 / DSM 2078 / JCM 9277 / NBRC 100435 / Kra 1) TaxID=768679 RepID=G4RL35_THETK|nr:archaeal proteasome endopeptidase complex subunit beta [Thermoproteus tenax]CCC82280.1 proteasome, beta subunit [Thermoproteus tenax Kra 1]
MSEEYNVGATAVGIRAKDGVVLAAEKRITYGFYSLSSSGKKVFIVNDRMAIASAGVIADMQTLAKILRVNAKMYELDAKRKPSVAAMAKLLSIIMFNRRWMPFIAEVLVGGYDEEGPHVFVLDPVGSLIEDDYAALGTGAKMAIGILDSGYKKDIDVVEARKLAINAIRAALERDPVSGGGIDLVIITPTETREEEVKVSAVLT